MSKKNEIKLYSHVRISGTDKTGVVVSFSSESKENPSVCSVELDDECCADGDDWLGWYDKKDLEVTD